MRTLIVIEINRCDWYLANPSVTLCIFKQYINLILVTLPFNLLHKRHILIGKCPKSGLRILHFYPRHKGKWTDAISCDVFVRKEYNILLK